MKKILSIMFAIILALSMGTVALAEDEKYEDMSTVTITKVYELTNLGTISPAETFTFSVENDSVTDAAERVTVESMPTPTIGSISYESGAAGSENKNGVATIELPEYTSVGIYTYLLQENDGKTAGVTYYDQKIKLVVTVLQDENGLIRVAAVHTETEGGEKADTFPNVYSAGSLKIAKKVTGNLGDREKYFKVTVTLNGDGEKVYEKSYGVTGGSYEQNPKTIEIETPTDFYLKHDDTITIENLPYGVTYTVAEADYIGEGYKAAKIVFEDPDKTMNTASETVTITNTKNQDIDTGILLDNVPYVLLLACVFGGMSVFFAKRRGSREE